MEKKLLGGKRNKINLEKYGIGICNIILFNRLGMNRIVITLITLLNAFELFAQTDLIFNYYCGNFKNDVKTTISIQSNNKSIELLNDTVRTSEYHKKDFFNEKNYMLKVIFDNKRFGTDSLNYSFSLSGNETSVNIRINFYLDKKVSQKKDKEEFVSGHIEVTKYYKPTQDIEIHYIKMKEPDEYYKEPFFVLKNNSNDTIYGEWLPGYFWGTISYLREDSTWTNQFGGEICTTFAPAPPLYPDSTTIASVASFGWKNNLPKKHYKYEVLYSINKFYGKGLSKYLEKKNFVWWADTKSFSKLSYEFDIE